MTGSDLLRARQAAFLARRDQLTRPVPHRGPQTPLEALTLAASASQARFLAAWQNRRAPREQGNQPNLEKSAEG
jgi:hypothetical protein